METKQQKNISSNHISSSAYEEEMDYEDDEPMTKEEMEDQYEEQKEREEEEEMERAASCKCGALQIMNYKVIQVADCICGAQAGHYFP